MDNLLSIDLTSFDIRGNSSVLKYLLDKDTVKEIKSDKLYTYEESIVFGFLLIGSVVKLNNLQSINIPIDLNTFTEVLSKCINLKGICVYLKDEYCNYFAGQIDNIAGKHSKLETITTYGPLGFREKYIVRFM
jgi:hypothetical protein